MHIAAPTPADAEELLAFELLNRRYFESWINYRPADYYTPDGVARAIAAAQQDADNDIGYQHLVRVDGKLVGRVNLTAVKRPHSRSASLGYRVGEAHVGRGIAKQAVRLVMQRAFTELDLWRLDATARPENLASAKVLLSNGFVQYGHSRRSFQLGGTWYDMLHFEVHAPPPAR